MAGNQQPTYNIVIKLPDGKRYEFEKATDFAWEVYENIPGRCRFSIPWNDAKIAAIATDSQFLTILIYRNTTLIWQGMVAYIQDERDKSTIYGLTFLEILKWYRSGYNITYTGKKIGTEIISPVWDTIAGRANAALGTLITKGTIENPYDTGTTNEKIVTRTLMDEDFFTLVNDMAILSRSNSPSGAWVQNAVFDISFHETTPTFTFKRNVGADQPLVVFELDSEIADFIQTKDFRYIRNDVKGLSVTDGPKVLTSTQTDSASQAGYYLREIGLVMGTATSQSALDESSKDFLKESKDPMQDWFVSFTSRLTPFNGYALGDNVKVKVNRGRINLDSFFRVVGLEVQINDKGGETAKPILRRKRT